MSILYKFRSGTTFEALPLPGSAARLFDVKKAIVVAKKLDAGSMEFDLSVRNASTNEEYVDESMILPRGTRLIVQRLPAAKGQGFLARMARNQYGGTAGGVGGHGNANGNGPAPSGFYTIDSTVRDEEDEEFVTHGNNDGDDEDDEDENEEDKELAALKAVTETATAATTGGIRPSGASHFGRSAGGPAGQGPPPQRQQHHHHHQGGGGGGDHQGHHRPGQAPNNKRQRPDADPELREQDKKDQPKKRATGIPRTFLSLSAPSNTADNPDGEDGEGNTAPMIQPNTIGFEELKSRGGGQSENATGTKKDLDYALKITDTTIPSYLKCGICQGVVKNAMFLSWDLEGRTACETCIRDALTKNGFRCPLTGQEGISPDDLHPNLAIRRAADEFVKGVMDKIEEIEKQGALEGAEQNEAANAKSSENNKKNNLLDGDTGDEKGVVVTKRGALANKRKAKEEDDPFGGDDEFGGDVFAVAAAEEKPPVEEEESSAKAAPPKPEAPKPVVVEEKENKKDPEAKKDDDNPVAATAPASESAPKEGDNPARNDTSSPSNRKSVNEDSANKDAPQEVGHSSSDYDRKGPPPPPPPPPSKNNSDRHQRPHYRRDNNTRQRRGPPAGYQMGPAGGATGPVVSYNDNGRSNDRNERNDDDRSQDSRGFGRNGGRGGGRSPHGRFNADRGGFRGGRGRGRFNGGRFIGQDQRGRGDHYGGGGGRGQPRNTRSLSPDNFSNGGGNDGRSNKRPRHESGDSLDGGRRQDNWDDRSAGSNDYQRQQQHNNNFRGRGFRGRVGPPRGGGGRFDDRFDRGGGRGVGGRFRGRGGGRFRGRGRY